MWGSSSNFYLCSAIIRSMMISKEELKKYKAIYKEEFREEIDDKTALDGFTRLVNFLRVVIYGGKK